MWEEYEESESTYNVGDYGYEPNDIEYQEVENKLKVLLIWKTQPWLSGKNMSIIDNIAKFQQQQEFISFAQYRALNNIWDRWNVEKWLAKKWNAKLKGTYDIAVRYSR